MAEGAYQIADRDIHAVVAEHTSEDAAFETVIASAVGAAKARMLRGLQALEEATLQTPRTEEAG